MYCRYADTGGSSQDVPSGITPSPALFVVYCCKGRPRNIIIYACKNCKMLNARYQSDRAPSIKQKSTTCVRAQPLTFSGFNFSTSHVERASSPQTIVQLLFHFAPYNYHDFFRNTSTTQNAIVLQKRLVSTSSVCVCVKKKIVCRVYRVKFVFYKEP